MPTKVYYDSDADLGLLKGKKIAIIGYGSQGHAQAQNLRDSGLDVIVADLPGTPNYELAIEHGFKPVSAAEAAKRIHQAISAGLVVACHDCSEGGLAVAMAEMAFAGGLGIEADLKGLAKSDDCNRIDSQLFSESNSRYILEVAPDKFDAFAKTMLNVPFGQIGKVISQKRLIIKDVSGNNVVDVDLDTLKQVWKKPLDF